jgi:hypothetical protein
MHGAPQDTMHYFLIMTAKPTFKKGLCCFFLLFLIAISQIYAFAYKK